MEDRRREARSKSPLSRIPTDINEEGAEQREGYGSDGVLSEWRMCKTK